MRRSSIFGGLFVVVLLVFGASPSSGKSQGNTSNPQSKIDSLQTEVSDLKNRVGALEGLISRLTGAISDLGAQLGGLEEAVAALQAGAGNDASQAIQDLRDAADLCLVLSCVLPQPIAINNVRITYLLPDGFFVQADQTGPAIFVAIPPGSLPTTPSRGNVISLTAREVRVFAEHRQVSAIQSYERVTTGVVVEDLIQEVSSAADLTTQLDSYESELLSLEGVIAGSGAVAGALPNGLPYWLFPIATPGVQNDTRLRIRVASNVVNFYGLDFGCTFRLKGVPASRFNDDMHLTSIGLGDFAEVSCPPGI